jgi:hypothetical protein
MTDSETLARTCLADNGRLIDPKYSQFPEREEQRLKARCKACWHLRAAFPSFVATYVEKWARAARDTGNDASGVGVPEAGRGVA